MRSVGVNLSNDLVCRCKTINNNGDSDYLHVGTIQLLEYTLFTAGYKLNSNVECTYTQA